MKYLLSLFALIFSCNAYSQITLVDTPHCYYHVLHGEVTGGIIPTSSGITVDDGWSGVIPIGFSYSFYGVANTQCIIGSNGCLGFNTASAGAYNTWPISASLATTTATDIRNVICGPWCDVYIPAGGTIEYSTQGTAPFRNFAVTWCGTRMYSCTTEWLTTQIIIYETTGIAEVHIEHRTICSTGWNGQKAIVGVKNAAGTVSTVPTTPSRDFPTIWTVSTPEAWRFTPAPGPTYTVAPTTFAPIPYATSVLYWYDSATHTYLGTGANIVVNPLVPTTYMAVALGCNDSTKAYIHVLPATCLRALGNNPCAGDSIKLQAVGDSVGAAYFWTGPAGFTSTVQYPFIYPATSAHTGLYKVTRTNFGGSPAKDSVWVTVHPLPIVNATSDLNVCDDVKDPVNLFASLDSLGETFKWTGPKGFTSTLQNPPITPFDSSWEGTYSVTGTTIWGCKASASTTLVPGITPIFYPHIHYGCNFDTVYFDNFSVNAKTYKWTFGDPSPNDLSRSTYHIYNKHDTFRVMLYMTNDHCVDTISKLIDLRHTINPIFDPTPDTICLEPGAAVNFANTSFAMDSGVIYPVTSLLWNFDDGSTDNSNATPSHTFATSGVFNVKLTVFDAMGCPDSVSHPVSVVQIKIKSFTDTTLCLSQPLALTNMIDVIPRGAWDMNFSWSESSPNLDDPNVQIPRVSGFGDFTDILTVTLPGVAPDACPTTQTIVIHSVMGAPLHNVTASQTIDYGNSVQLNAGGEVYYRWIPNDGSLDNNNINNPIATPKQTTTYTVFGYDVNGCLDSAQITVFVDSTMNQDIPTGFTPNGDGNNDVFKPAGLKFQNMVEFRIFNRWGQEVFFTNNKENGWDGTFHGVPQDMGVYNFAIIVARPGVGNVVYKGNVTLIR